jgi:hypothetical protein
MKTVQLTKLDPQGRASTSPVPSSTHADRDEPWTLRVSYPLTVSGQRPQAPPSATSPFEWCVSADRHWMVSGWHPHTFASKGCVHQQT